MLSASAGDSQERPATSDTSRRQRTVAQRLVVSRSISLPCTQDPDPDKAMQGCVACFLLLGREGGMVGCGLAIRCAHSPDSHGLLTAESRVALARSLVHGITCCCYSVHALQHDILPAPACDGWARPTALAALKLRSIKCLSRGLTCGVGPAMAGIFTGTSSSWRATRARPLALLPGPAVQGAAGQHSRGDMQPLSVCMQRCDLELLLAAAEDGRLGTYRRC